MEQVLLTNREFAGLLRVSLATFYSLKRGGTFVGLEAPVPHRWSRDRVEAWLRGQDERPRRKTRVA